MKLIACLCLLQFAGFTGYTDDASHRAAAARLVEAMPSSEARDAVEGRLKLESIYAFATATKAKASKETHKEVAQNVKEWADEAIKSTDIKPLIVDIYVKEFTEVELDDLFAFYQSPVGKKLVARHDAIRKQLAEIGAKIDADKRGELKNRVKLTLERHGGHKEP